MSKHGSLNVDAQEMVFVEGLGLRIRAGDKGFLVDNLWELFLTGNPELDNRQGMNRMKEVLSVPRPRPKRLKRVYLVGFDDGMTKVGVSKNPEARKCQIEKASGRKSVEFFVTEATEFAFKVESEFMVHFAALRADGEFYKLPYPTALEVLKAIFRRSSLQLAASL